MSTRLRQSVVAIATVLACVALMASPASADEFEVDLISGGFTFSKTGSTSLVVPIDGTGGTVCSDDYAVEHLATPTLRFTAYSVVTQFIWAGTPYLLSITRTGSTAGSSSAGTFTGSTLSLRIDFHTVSTTTCTPGTLICRMNTTLPLTGTHTGTSSAFAVSDTFHKTGASSTLALGGACAAPFSTYAGGVVDEKSTTYHIKLKKI